MKAAVVHEFGAPLLVEEVPTPVPDEGEVLVRVEASGLCHTDIHAARGDWPVKPKLPLIPGHEGVGIVEALGPGARNGIAEGDRVALPWLGYACGHCRYCEAGWETLCESQLNMGYFMDGAYAEYVKGKVRHVVKVPEGASYSWTEAPSGITGYYLVSTGDKVPWRMKVRSPSFSNVAALRTMVPGTRVEDLELLLASLFYMVGDIDR